MNAQQMNREIESTGPTVISGALGNLDILEGAYCPVPWAAQVIQPVMPMAFPRTRTQIQTNSWLATMILLVGLGSWSLQHRVNPATPQVAPSATAPAEMMKTDAPSVAPAQQTQSAAKKAVKMQDVKLKLDRILQRADSIKAKLARQ